MKLSKREIVLLSVLVTMILGTVLYFFIYTPLAERTEFIRREIAQREKELDDAVMRTLRWGGLTNSRNAIEDRWQAYTKKLPENFDDADILRRIQNIIIPHTQNVNVTFSGTSDSLLATRIYTVGISFTVNYSKLNVILEGFANEDIYNRIVDYTYSVVGYENSLPLIQVSMSVEFLTMV